MCRPNEPKFKAGDRVQRQDGGDVLEIGERLGPLRTHHGEPFFMCHPDDYCYTIADGEIGARVYPEAWLRRADRWKPCPGPHRFPPAGGMVSKSATYDGLERRVE
jgi:hypothetical protein